MAHKGTWVSGMGPLHKGDTVDYQSNVYEVRMQIDFAGPNPSKSKNQYKLRPDLAAQPTPEPTPTPTPEPAPEPTPAPVPAPIVVPEKAPEVTPQLEPSPAMVAWLVEIRSLVAEARALVARMEKAGLPVPDKFKAELDIVAVTVSPTVN